MQVQQQRIAPHAAQHDAAARHQQVLAAGAGDGMDFVRQKALDAGGAGQKQMQLVHKQGRKHTRLRHCLRKRMGMCTVPAAFGAGPSIALR
ncbi:hypothetical protein GCM10027195_11480 [Comamonas sediminis]